MQRTRSYWSSHLLYFKSNKSRPPRYFS